MYKKITLRSPEIFAPARIPVAAGKKTANTEKKSCSEEKCGPKLSRNIVTTKQRKC